MTDNEKRQQKAMLLLECHEAEVSLARLQGKAVRLSRKLDQLVQEIKDSQTLVLDLRSRKRSLGLR